MRAVKGQDERSLTATPLTALHASRSTAMSENKEGRHVGLDFYNLLVEEEAFFDGTFDGMLRLASTSRSRYIPASSKRAATGAP